MDFKFLKNAIIVMISNLFVLLSGIAAGILLPGIMTIGEYGYYKTFTLYLTYAGLTHLGFPNGLYLDYSGFDYSEIPKEKFITYFRYYIIEQVVMSFIAILVLMIVSYCDNGNTVSNKMITPIIIEIFLLNVINYFQLISQSIQKFKQLSVMNTIKSILFIVLILGMVLSVQQRNISEITANNYIRSYIAITTFLVVCYLFLYRNICFGKGYNILTCVNEISVLHKKGVHLLIAGIIATIIFTLDRQFVSILFDVETYGTYSFAYSILNLISTMVGSITLVVYPTLKTLKKEEMMNKYVVSIEYLSLFVSAVLFLYYPLKSFIVWFLPDYVAAIEIFRIILPGICLSSIITILLSNYYKALGEIKMYSVISVSILIIAALINTAAYILFQTPSAISAASVLTMILWYVFADLYLYKKYRLSGIGGLRINLTALAVFYISTIMRDNIGVQIYIGYIILELLVCICRKHL